MTWPFNSRDHSAEIKSTSLFLSLSAICDSCPGAWAITLAVSVDTRILLSLTLPSLWVMQSEIHQQRLWLAWHDLSFEECVFDWLAFCLAAILTKSKPCSQKLNGHSGKQKLPNHHNLSPSLLCCCLYYFIGSYRALFPWLDIAGRTSWWGRIKLN